MRIGVITTSYPRYPGEPAGHFVAQLNDWLLDCGHEVEVIAAGCGDYSDDWHRATVIRVPADDSLFYAGGAPDALQGTGKTSSLCAKFSAAKFSARLVRAMMSRAGEYDGIVAHWLAPSALTAVLTAPRLPIWAIAHGGDVHALAKMNLLGVSARAFDRPNVHLNFVSQSSKSVFFSGLNGRHDAMKERAGVFPMGIDVERFKRIAASRTNPENATAVVFLGRLIELKGASLLLEALARINSETRVIIAGTGPAEQTLHKQAEELGLSIDWRGQVDAEGRDKLLAEAAVVVMPSRQSHGRREGMPLVALEALASGAQLLVSDSGGLSEIPESICHRFAEGDVGALQGQLQAILAGATARFAPGHWLEERSWTSLAPRILPGLTPVH